MKSWIPSIILIFLLFSLVAATRIYIGGPDGLEFVWKGEFNFRDTVVNVGEFVGVPSNELVASHPAALLSQMAEMGLLNQYEEAYLERHRVKKTAGNKAVRWKNESDNSDKTQSPDAGTTSKGPTSSAGITSSAGTASSSAPTATNTTAENATESPPHNNNNSDKKDSSQRAD